MAAADEPFLSFLLPRRDAFRVTPGLLAGPARGHFVRMGSVVIGVIAMLFILLQTIVQSPIIPGNWSSYGPSFQVDLLYAIIALGMLAIMPLTNPAKARSLVVQPGGITGFVLTWSIFALGGMAVMLGILTASGQEARILPLSDVARLQAVIQFGLMTAVGETLLFQVAINNFFNNPLVGGIASSVLFGFFHVLVRTVSLAGVPGLQGLALVASIGQTMFIGGIFWVVQQLWGAGACIGVHGAVDCALAGVMVVHGVAAGGTAFLLLSF